MNRLILLSFCLVLSGQIAVAQKEAQKPRSFTRSILKNATDFFGSFSTQQKNQAKQFKKIKNKKFKGSAAAVFVDKKDLIDPNSFRKISSKNIQKKINKYIKLISNSCSPKYKTPYKRLDLFKINIVKLRTYLEGVIDSSDVDLDKQMESKGIYSQVSEENFPVLQIIDEDVPIKEKVISLEESFNSYYMYSYQRNKDDMVYESWAQTIINGITCIDGQSL